MSVTQTILPLSTKVTLRRFPADNWRASENHGWWIEAHIKYHPDKHCPDGEVGYLLRHPSGGMTHARPDEVTPA